MHNIKLLHVNAYQTFFYGKTYFSFVIPLLVPFRVNVRAYLSTERSSALPTCDRHIVFCDVMTNVLVERYGRFEGS
jgi:hypothetical protein